MEGPHSKTCGECYHYFRLGEEELGECFAHPPKVFKIVKVSINPLTRQPSQDEGLISHYPVVRLGNRACGEFKIRLFDVKPNLIGVERKERKS